jgi:hypothetical protein
VECHITGDVDFSDCGTCHALILQRRSGLAGIIWRSKGTTTAWAET